MTADHGPRSASIAIDFAAQSGTTYEFSKAVGIATSQDSSDPQRPPRPRPRARTRRVRRPPRPRTQQAWADRWRSDIVLPDDPAMQRGSAPPSSTCRRASGPAPTGASRRSACPPSGYNDHVFWDAETWMYPSLLLLHPDVASSVVDYRSRTRSPARGPTLRHTGYAGRAVCLGERQRRHRADADLGRDAHLRAAHHRGRRASPSGSTTSRPATGAGWRARAGRCSRAPPTSGPAGPTSTGNGGYAITGVEGPDEHHFNVDNEVYTNVGAITTMRLATQAAALLGKQPDPAWKTVADGLPVLLDPSSQMRPEFEGYAGDTIKQADVVMLTYPWEWHESQTIGLNDLNYYAHAHRSRRAGDDRLDPRDRLARARRPRLPGLRLHAAQRPAVRAAAVRSVHRGARRPGHVHVPDRRGRVPADLPVRLERASAGARTASTSTRPCPTSGRPAG